MDTMPPQAPPALTQSPYAAATDAFDRLVGLQAWLATQTAAMPALPETFDNAAIGPYRAAVESFWQAPAEGSAGASRRDTLAAHLASAALDLALLGHHDGTLDGDALALARDLRASGPLPAHLSVREPMFGTTPYAGVLLIQDLRTPERVLLFSTQLGWEAFPRLADALAALERRARRGLADQPDLPGIARQHLAHLGPDPFVTSRPLAGPPFDTLVQRLIDVQRDKLEQAGFEFALARDGQTRDAVLTDTVFDALRLDRAVDVTALLAVRHGSLMEAFNTQRLARVPAAVAQHWREAEDAYRSTLAAITTREAQAGLATPPSLTDYATTALGERLRARGITHDPADIQVQIDRGTDPAARLESLQALFQGPAPAHIRLLDLAYQNLAAFEPVRLSAQAGDGTPLPALDDAAIRQLVRDLDLATRYPALVQTTFRTGPEAPIRREHAASLQRAHMGLLAAEARLSYYLHDAPRSFRTDHAERGYRWVQAALDAPDPAHRARVEGHEVVVRQVTYRGTPVRDLLVFGVRNPASVPSIVMYTPDAPDGITFREFDDRAEAGRRLLYHPAFREYLLDRLPADEARVLPNGSARAFAGDHLAQWVLGTSDTSDYTRTDVRFEERDIEGDFLHAAYQTDIQLGLRNVLTLTRSAEQAHWAWLVDRLGSSLSQRILHDVLQGVLTAPARAAQAAWRFYDNVKAGDHAHAVVDFADFYNASLAAAAPVHALGSAPLARAILGARVRFAGRLVEARPAVQPAVVFEAGYLAKGVHTSAPPNAQGIFTLQGRSYIEHRGHLYGVRYDPHIGTWRLSRPGGNPAFRGPAIRRTGDGSWAFHQLGPRGGTGRGAPGAQAEIYNEYLDEFERAFPDPFERDLVRTQMRRELTENTPATNVSAAQRLRWNEATARAYERNRALAETQPAYPGPGVAHDMVVPRVPTPPSMPAGYRLPTLAEVPEELWYYGSKPFKNSSLERLKASGNHGFSPNWASIRTELVDRRMSGLRLSTVPPTAPIEEIRAASGIRAARGDMFAVRIHPRTMLTVSERSRNPQASLLLREQGPAGRYVMRAPEGNRVQFHRHQHEVISKLPDEAR
ncbi:hypothetical protein J2T07_001161 [Luteibacter jiangsuensis]|uniref:Uncharacterized protein n=1 Tax=Luteibacter jiangsuensis TaxID=637577 RepID=A0ABT9SVG0_9GAMM|nr:DUF6543 domain-containing protein [Luteibacter jiangsuensis]MDQ0008984.1 hypothetical protein [Luteibacter jiangsuensis]